MSDDRRARRLLQGIKAGEVITAEWLQAMTDAVNANTRAVSAPTQKRNVRTGDSTGAQGGSGSSGGVGDESFSAGASDITSTTVTITDSNGDTHDIERIDTIVFTEDNTGRTMTLDITYT